MKKIIFLILILFVYLSCDPIIETDPAGWTIFYIHNQSDYALFLSAKLKGNNETFTLDLPMKQNIFIGKTSGGIGTFAFPGKIYAEINLSLADRTDDIIVYTQKPVEKEFWKLEKKSGKNGVKKAHYTLEITNSDLSSDKIPVTKTEGPSL